ncbi:hypothetical protein HanIR_Chr02g0062541 [Helianthus annuus]|nr:hypothetical protein HanIR_Chr02g0062541 [Helianthus annuus]
MIESNPKKKALLIHQDDEKVAEGFSWDKYVPPDSALAAGIKKGNQEEILSDCVNNQVTAHGRKIPQGKHYVFVVEIKEKTREEILKEKTYRERNIAWNRINEMQEEYENVVSNKR